METWEYLQISINYYAIEASRVSLPDQKDSEVWKGLENYLKSLSKLGWIIVNEAQSDGGRVRTYHLKRPVAQAVE